MKEDAADSFSQHGAIYIDAVKKYVCDHCEDMGEDGLCHTKDPEGCGVFRSLPELIRIAHQLHELKLEPYIKAVRERVCSTCRDSSGLGKCEIREHLDCSLDNYLPLVLEAIEEVNRQLGSY